MTLCYQPSSSLRAAEPLESTGAASSFNVGIPFSGVESVKIANDDSSIESIDADFSVVIKRLSKKDSTTKLKVTHLFSYSLCHNEGDHLSGKPVNVMDFDSCQGNVMDLQNVWEVSGKTLAKIVFC